MFRVCAPSVGFLFGLALALNSAPALAGTYRQLYAFQGRGDGAYPFAGLIDVNGTLYGTTDGGDNGDHGTVFSLDPMAGSETVLHSFLGGSDGAYPWGGLVQAGGRFYGTTNGGGAGDDGTVFWLNPRTRAEGVVYAFKGGSDGGGPEASLIKVRGSLFGTTHAGGNAGGDGTVFSLDRKTGAETVACSFGNGTPDGPSAPRASLLNVGGTLYGTSAYGGIGGNGAVFSVNPKSNVCNLVYAFAGGSDASGPVANLTRVGDTLYGTTVYGGCASCFVGYGTVFAVDLTTGAESIVYAFKGGSDAAYPYAGLVRIGSKLYGTTEDGGLHDFGAVFRIDTKTGAEAVLYSFQGGSDGAYPTSALVDADGTLYGTTESGGSTNCSGGCGTVFSYVP